MLLALLILCALMSGWFSLMETSIAESHRTRLEKQSEDGDAESQTMLKILDAPENLLAAAQAGFALSIMLAGLASILFAPFILNRLSDMQFGWALAIIAAFCITAIVVLLIGVFIPRAAARHNPEQILLEHYKGFTRSAMLMTPLTFVLTKLTGVAMMLSGSSANVQEDAVTEDVVKDLIEQGTSDGTFEQEEKNMVGRVFELGDETAYSLMTPRTQMVWLDLNDSLEHNLKVIRDNLSTILPVGEGNLDECRGLLYAKDLLDAALAEDGAEKIARQAIKLDELLHKPMYVPSSMDTFRLLEKFRNTGVHEAIVLDEYGGVVGFITLDDILVEVIGKSEVTSPADAQMTNINENTWLVDGLLDIDDFKKSLNIDALPDEERNHFQTMGGFITSYFGYIPKIGESFIWNELKFEVILMDRARVDQIRVTKLASSAES